MRGEKVLGAVELPCKSQREQRLQSHFHGHSLRLWWGCLSRQHGRSNAAPTQPMLPPNTASYPALPQSIHPSLGCASVHWLIWLLMLCQEPRNNNNPRPWPWPLWAHTLTSAIVHKTVEFLFSVGFPLAITSPLRVDLVCLATLCPCHVLDCLLSLVDAQLNDGSLCHPPFFFFFFPLRLFGLIVRFLSSFALIFNLQLIKIFPSLTLPSS